MAGVAAYALCSIFGVAERWHSLAHQYEHYVDLDELPTAFLVTGIGFAWFAWRRWRDYARTANELCLANEELSRQFDRNQEIIADLRDARQKALDLDRAKTRFLAHMSHELRTPLNAIIGFSELMQMQAYEALGAENYATYTTSIQDSGHHLLDLINDLLDLSRIESGDLTPNATEVSIGSIADAASKMFVERAANKGIHLTCPQTQAGLFEANVDARMIRQVLINLLSNAIRHTPEGGAVEIAPYCNDDGTFGFTVTDNGDGMDIGVAKRIQTGFAEVENAMRREHHGAGLGLPLSRSIMEAHGGTLTLESVKGEGTRIALWLPANLAVRRSMQSTVRRA